MTLLDHPIPVTIITGFLGAGKTTLLNHILQTQISRCFGVLLNDFGAVNIDAELVVDAEGGIINLANGCICCSIRKEFIAAVLGMLNRAKPPEYILIETSGVANPAAVTRALDIPELYGKIQVDSIITVVDVEQVWGLTGEIAKLVKAQIVAANLILLNKMELVDKHRLSAVHNWLVELNPGAPVFDVTFGHAPIDVLRTLKDQARKQESLSVEFAIEAQTVREIAETNQEVSQNHEHMFDIWTYTSPIPIRVAMFQAFIDQLPEYIYRVKGFLHLAERPKTRTILQKVGHRTSLSRGEAWNGTPQTWLVFIGAKGSLDKVTLEAEMEACQEPWWSRWTKRKG